MLSVEAAKAPGEAQLRTEGGLTPSGESWSRGSTGHLGKALVRTLGKTRQAFQLRFAQRNPMAIAVAIAPRTREDG